MASTAPAGYAAGSEPEAERSPLDRSRRRPRAERATLTPMALQTSKEIPRWEARERRFALGLALTVGIALGVLPPWLAPERVGGLLSAAIGLATGASAYWLLTRRVRRRAQIRRRPFPTAWEPILQREVAFYRALEQPGRQRFRRDLQLFLGEKRVTGIGMELDETTYVLVGASAVIPVFGYPEWEWHTISEVLVYPDRFNTDFEVDAANRTLGMVGTGMLNRLMILSKPDLVAGFRNPADKRNVGLHEFAHLVDKADGTIDGIPGIGLDRRTLNPWLKLVKREMEAIRSGDSDIDPYALTNEAEFFAVTTEYFFERPDVMERKHPELFAALERIFKQQLGGQLERITSAMRSRPKRLGRNSPCPCGSGSKYKKCCLKRARG